MSKKSGINNTPTRDQINRKFDSMFPGVSAENQRHLQDTLAWGRTYADRQRAIRSNDTIKQIRQNLWLDQEIKTLEQLKCTIGISMDVFEPSFKTLFYSPEKDGEGNWIINHETKTVRFICEENGDIIEEHFI